MDIKGHIVEKILVVRAIDIKKEFYIGITVDNIKSDVVLIASSAGGVEIELTEAGQRDDLLVGFPAKFMAFGGHKEACQRLPKGVTLLAKSLNCPIQMMRIGKNIYATQFHTELDTKGIELRINSYKNHGYFSPDEADSIINTTKKCDVIAPYRILRNFVGKYKQ